MGAGWTSEANRRTSESNRLDFRVELTGLREQSAGLTV